MLQQNTFGMEPKGESHIAVGESPIAAPTVNGDAIDELPQKTIPAVFMDGCALLLKRGWVLTGGNTAINELLPIDE